MPTAIADRQLHAALFQSGEQAFCGNVSNQCILREWAATEAADGRIETAAAGVIRSKYFQFSLGGRAVEVHADVVVGGTVTDSNTLSNQIRTRDTDGVSKRNGLYTEIDKFIERLAKFRFIPRVAIRVSKRHRNVNDSS